MEPLRARPLDRHLKEVALPDTGGAREQEPLSVTGSRPRKRPRDLRDHLLPAEDRGARRLALECRAGHRQKEPRTPL